jgi:hypothetical protein
MAKIGALLVLAICLASFAHADAVPLPFSWSSYVGESQWNVIATEDDSSCGGHISHTQYTMTMQHNLTFAVMGNVGHGNVSGTFEGNTLHIKSRVVPDSGGESTLSAYDVVFSSDCSSFTTMYSWDYRGRGSCSGTTKLDGTSTKTSCPAPTVVPVIPEVAPPTTESLRGEITDAREDLQTTLESLKMMNGYQAAVNADNNALPEFSDEMKAKANEEKARYDALEPKVEARYKAILDKDPNNFWANWDMAELRKKQGKYDEFFAYVDTAASNKNQFEGTKNVELETNIAHDLGLSKFPTVDNSRVVKTISDETGRWTGGMIYNVNVPAKDKGTIDTLLYTVLSERAYNFVNRVAGLPGDNK